MNALVFSFADCPVASTAIFAACVAGGAVVALIGVGVIA